MSETADYLYMCDLLESLHEFHPEAFNVLDEDELKTLRDYFFPELPPDVDVLKRRRSLVNSDTTLETRVTTLASRVCDEVGIRGMFSATRR
jgi:hypothetical protein